MKHEILRTAAFLLIFVLLFAVVQEILTPDHNQNQNVWYTVNGFENLGKNSIDILYLGDSQIYFGISPMKLYEDTGICSYNLGTSAQPMGLSYLLLQWALKTQSPAVVVLSPVGIFGQYHGYTHWRFFIDNVPFSFDKINMAKEYAKAPGNDGFWSILFPILKFHDRWEELSRDDFIRRHVDQYYTAGQYVENRIVPTQLDKNVMNEIAGAMEQRNNVNVIYADENGTQTSVVNSPLWEPQVTEENLEYLYKIHELCEQSGTELVLLKPPSVAFPMLKSSAWTVDEYDIVKELADQLGCPYLDMDYDVDPVVDYTIDTCDAGTHLNFRGAEKLTTYLESYLINNYNLTQDRNDTWDAMLDKYSIVREVSYLQMETDFHAYLEKLIEHKNDWSVLIAASEEYSSALTEEEFYLFDQLGFQLIREGGFADSYLGVTQRGEREYEATSPRRITYNTTFSHDADVQMASSGWYSKSEASIKINGTEFSRNGVGLNIVVWDNETGLVLDSVSINTRYPGESVYHSGYIYAYILDYESVMCLDGTRVS